MKKHILIHTTDDGDWENLEEALMEAEVDYVIKNNDYTTNTIVVDSKDVAIASEVLDGLNIVFAILEDL